MTTMRTFEEKLQLRYPGLPWDVTMTELDDEPGVDVAVWQDEAKLLKSRYELMLKNGAMGLILVILALGLIFQMPVAVFFLARFNVISAGFMLKHFKYAVLGIVVLAAVITPSGDVVTLGVFAGPMLVLYLISIGVAWIFGKKRVRDDEADQE